jgi:phage terminase large subunit-like protein
MEAEEILKVSLEQLENHYKTFNFYEPHAKQLIFHSVGLEAQERLITGGNRSGKSYSSAIEVAKHVSGLYGDDWNGYKFDKPIRAWIVGKTAPVIVETIQKDLLGDVDQGLRGILHSSLIESKKKSGNTEMYRTIYINHISGGKSKITFKTFEEGREAFQGSKVNLIWIDEEPPFPIYQECKMRTMATSDDFRGMMIVSSTPLKGYSDFFNYFMDDRHPEETKDSIWHAHITWDDATHLSEPEKKRLLAGMSPHEMEARTKGVPWPGSGLVYPVPESMLLCDPFEIPKHWPRVFGLDFGWSNPTATLFAAHDRDNDVVYFYAEYAVSERTPQHHANELLKFGVNWMPGVYDPAGRNSQQADGKTLVGLYQEAGLRNLSPANNSKEEGILKVLQRMQAGQIKIFNTLAKTRSEFRKYARDEDGIPNKKDDHLMDAMRYIVMSGLGIAMPENYMDPKYRGRYGRPSEPSYM